MEPVSLAVAEMGQFALGVVPRLTACAGLARDQRPRAAFALAVRVAV